jgi:hypothetical protein
MQNHVMPDILKTKMVDANILNEYRRILDGILTKKKKS